MDIIALLQCLRPTLTATTIRQFSRIIFALFAMTGRVTMLGISRWAGTGGSYRTIQRWFYARIPWAQVFMHLFRQHLFQANAAYILAGDEVVVTTAGKHTFGLDRFFSGLLQKVVPGLSFFALSLINTADQTSSPIAVEQVVRSKPVSVPTPPPVSQSHWQRQTGASGWEQEQEQGRCDSDAGIATDSNDDSSPFAQAGGMAVRDLSGTGWTLWKQ